jgi:hypothetical protein
MLLDRPRDRRRAQRAYRVRVILISASITLIAAIIVSARLSFANIWPYLIGTWFFIFLVGWIVNRFSTDGWD